MSEPASGFVPFWLNDSCESQLELELGSRQYKDPQHHAGGYWQISYTRRMKGRTEYIRREWVTELRRQVVTRKRFKRLVDQWIGPGIEHSRLRSCKKILGTGLCGVCGDRPVCPQGTHSPVPRDTLICPEINGPYQADAFLSYRILPRSSYRRLSAVFMMCSPAPSSAGAMGASAP